MNIDGIGKLISEYTEKLFIVDTTGKIIWTSKRFKEELKNNFRIDLDFEELSAGLINDFKASSEKTISIGKDKTLLKGHWISIDGFEYLLVTLKSLVSLDDLELRCYALESIIERISDGIILSDYKGKVKIYNTSMEKLEDKSSEEMVGNYLWDAYGYEGESNSEHREVFYSGRPVLNEYKAHTYSRGIPKYVSYSTYPLVKSDNMIGVYTVSKNETKLHNLLSETVELKRKFLNESGQQKHKKVKPNGTQYSFADIIGSSNSMERIINEAESISWLDTNVLIVGATGTGKEMFAQSIHNYGKRQEEPFIGINCSAIPENLLESILFGTVKGAFTGAIDQKGLFQEAENGTLFLDELNSMPISMQTKLLRVIQEKIVRPVGGNTTVPVNCRIISAMNEDPLDLIRMGKLREDLYYRIAGFNIFIPPLSERKADILDLADHFISRLNNEVGKNVIGISTELKKFMVEYSWPGNVRELQNFIENIIIRVSEEDRHLRINHIPPYISKKINSSYALNEINETGESLTTTLNNIEKRIILETLEKNNWNISKSSRDLGIIRQSLIYRMKKLSIAKK